MNVFPPIITIDGPSGVGKGAVSKELSKKLKWNILDSGAIYRVLALKSLLKNIAIDLSHEEELMKIAENLNITFANESEELNIFSDGKIIDHEIYSESIGDLASRLAVFAKVRRILLRYQRNFCKFPGLVANGRDMGTVVFPNASLKIYLDASYKVRCKRRMCQLEKRGVRVDFDYLLKKIKDRDNRDCTRSIAPLVPARSSLMFNSTYFKLNEIVYTVLKCFYNSYVI